MTKGDQYQGRNIDEMTSFLREALARPRSRSQRLAGRVRERDPRRALARSAARRSPTGRTSSPGRAGSGALLGAISTHVLGAIERDRYLALLEEGRRVTDELARPHRERLAVLEDGVDPQARLNQVRRQLAALPDSRALRARLDQELQALYRRMNRTLAQRLQAMNHDLEDQIEFRWKKSMRRTLPNAYDQRFREIWLEVVRTHQRGRGGDRGRALAGVWRGPAVSSSVRTPVTRAAPARSRRRLGSASGFRGGPWMKIIWLSFVSLGFLFPAQYMEHRDAMRSADQNEARGAGCGAASRCRPRALRRAARARRARLANGAGGGRAARSGPPAQP